jgi:hypothetical protein
MVPSRAAAHRAFTTRAGSNPIGGPKVARLQNAKGVVLELHGVQLGLEANLSLGGMTIALR